MRNVRCPHCDGSFTIPDEPDDSSKIGDLLGAIDRKKLSEVAMEFYDQTVERYDKYGEDTRMSPKQMAWLRKLAKR